MQWLIERSSSAVTTKPRKNGFWKVRALPGEERVERQNWRSRKSPKLKANEDSWFEVLDIGFEE